MGYWGLIVVRSREAVGHIHSPEVVAAHNREEEVAHSQAGVARSPEAAVAHSQEAEGHSREVAVVVPAHPKARRRARRS